MKNKRTVCNVVQSHKRILEAHRLWHQALQCYFDPEGFRTNVNAAIQALRNVTFAIQNEEKKIPGYSNWYSDWRQKLKADKIMSWLCEARTDIVHKKDLEMYSSAAVSVQCYEKILDAAVNIPIFLSGKAILEHLWNEGYINEFHKDLDAYAVIERRWVVNAFPQDDVLYLLAYGIGQLTKLVQEAHEKSGITMEECSVVDSLHSIKLNDDTIPVCMEFTSNAMIEKIAIKDFVERRYSYTVVSPDKKLDQKAKHRYRKVLSELSLKQCSDPFEYGRQLYSTAKEILKIDGHHTNLLASKRSDGTWNLMSPVFQDQVAKHIFWNDFARTVRKEKIVAVIFVAECWLGSLEVLEKSGLRASEQPDKKEALTVDVFTSEMKGKSYKAIFHRNLIGKIVIDEDTIEEEMDMTCGYIRPVTDIWKENESRVD